MKKDRRDKHDVALSTKFFCCIIVLIFFTTFCLFSRPGKFHPVLATAWRSKPVVEAIAGEFPVISVRETVLQPDEKLFFLDYYTIDRSAQSRVRFIGKHDVVCVYFSANSSHPGHNQPVQPLVSVEADYVRCPLQPRGATVSIAFKSGDGNGPLLAGPKAHRWDFLSYETMIDHDNSTIVFVKGLNLRPGKVSNASRFECVYGWDFTSAKFVLRSHVITIAQEIVRCKTPLSILNRPQTINGSLKVSVRVKGKGTVPSVARPGVRPESDPTAQKAHEVCVCTMARNQGRFLKEWVMYHARIGVTRWFLYDNNSNDDTEDMIEWLSDAGHNITRHAWPWVKTQEAGFAHCALRARDHCRWVGFIDVDEFFHSPHGLSLPDLTRNQSKSVGEIRTSCHSFGPSGRKEAPREGVTAGYTCRAAMPERHKSVVRPEALSESLVNVVHHFDLREGSGYVHVERGVMVVNHYKYQVWSVFREKFYRRVATYVADWEEEMNAGSKDRAPGLGFKAVEPEDWSSRFCEVWDTELKDRVVQMFTDPETNGLPWEEH